MRTTDYFIIIPLILVLNGCKTLSPKSRVNAFFSIYLLYLMAYAGFQVHLSGRHFFHGIDPVKNWSSGDKL